MRNYSLIILSYGMLQRFTDIMCAAYADWQLQRDLEGHTDTTLQELRDMLDRMHALFRALFDHVRDGDFNILKIHIMLHYEDAIRRFGGVRLYDTGPYESLHRIFCKRPFRGSNRQRASLVKQVYNQTTFVINTVYLRYSSWSSDAAIFAQQGLVSKSKLLASLWSHCLGSTLSKGGTDEACKESILCDYSTSAVGSTAQMVQFVYRKAVARGLIASLDDEDAPPKRPGVLQRAEEAGAHVLPAKGTSVAYGPWEGGAGE